MVTYAQLRAADSASWQPAADAVLNLAKEMEEAANTIHARGTGPVADNWTDAVGQAAADTLKRTGDDYTEAGYLVRGAVSVLDTFQDAVDVAKREVDSALMWATSAGMQVDSLGAVYFISTEKDEQTSALEYGKTDQHNLVAVQRIQSTLDGLNKP